MLADVEDRFLSLRPVGARGTAGESGGVKEESARGKRETYH